MKLCGTPGQSDAEWAKTLRDGADKFRANTALPEEARRQVVTAIEAELAKLAATPAPQAPALVAAPPLQARRGILPARTATPEYSALPPFPPPPPPPSAATGAGAAMSGSAAATVAAAPSLPVLARPKLNLSCYTPGDIGGAGPCFAFERDTMIMVEAREALQNTSLRFARGNGAQADLPIPQLAKGRSARLTLPSAVCAGAVGGTLTIRILRAPAGRPAAAQVVGSEGPYNLRC